MQNTDEPSENILGIDFLQKFRLHYDQQNQQTQFLPNPSKALFATKSFTLPPFSTSLVQARSFQKIDNPQNYIANIGVPKHPLISGPSSWVSFDGNNHCTIQLQNCAPYEITLDTRDIMGIADIEDTTPIPFNDDSLATICEQIYQRLPKVKKKAWTRKEIEDRCHLGAPKEYRDQYIDTLFKHQAAISLDKYDLGLAKDFTHRIHLKDEQPIYRKQFNLPDAHTQFIEQTLDEWLKLGVVRRSNSPYNSPIFCVPKKQGQGLRIVQDFQQLNQHSHTDKYSMKEISECLGDIGRANSSIFSMLDLTSGFWQMKLEPDLQPLTAFTIPNRGQFHWITSPMGLLGCPASFQRLMEQVLRGLQNILIYIDNLLIHTSTHETHLKALEKVLLRLQQHHLKINLDKCLFRDQQVSYLGFTLTPQGIKQGQAKLKAIRMARAPTDVKEIWSFIGLCNFFQNHIQNFAITAAPLFKLTRQDSGYTSGPLPKAASQAFLELQSQLCQEHTLAFPRSDQKYLLITNGITPMTTLPGGFCATLDQQNDENQIKIISHASRQLKENENNYTPFLLETAAAVWGIDNFNEYLKGSRFTLYMDPTPKSDLGTTQMKTWNRLKTAMSEHHFNTKNCQTSNIPLKLKQKQQFLQINEVNNQNFNKIVHIDTFQSISHTNNVITAITDEATAYSITTISDVTDPDFLLKDLQNKWFVQFDIPDTLLLKQGKVPISKLQQKINQIAPLTRTIKCKIRNNTFNTDTEQQWQQTRHQIHKEEFTSAMNLFHNLQNPQIGDESEVSMAPLENSHRHENLSTENFVEADESEFEEESSSRICAHKNAKTERRAIKLCRHKLQQRQFCRHKPIKIMPLEDHWPQQQQVKHDQEQVEQFTTNQDPEWGQLLEMEQYLRQQKEKLQQQEASDHHHSEQRHQEGANDDLPWHEHWDKSNPEEDPDEGDIEYLPWHEHWDKSNPEEDPDEADLEYITYILDSLAKNESKTNFSSSNKNSYPDNQKNSASLQGCPKHKATPTKFNYKPIIKMLPPFEFSWEQRWNQDTLSHPAKSELALKLHKSIETSPVNSITGE